LVTELNSSNVIQSGFLALPCLQDSYGVGENTFYTFVDGKDGAPAGVVVASVVAPAFGEQQAARW
jgi:hypothetical protein